jgi:hypothetical protein
MAISISQFVDLLVKKLDGVAKTDTAVNKGPSNENIPSPLLNRGDTCWTDAVSIPTVAVATANLVIDRKFGNAVQCTADDTTVAIGGIFPTWLTGVTDWIPPDFGSTYSVSAYVGPPGAANIVATGTFISSAGQAGTGEWYFDYQAGLLNFIGETIPASLTSGNVVYITGYSYDGLTGVTNLPSNTEIANIVFNNTTMSSNSIGNLVTFSGAEGIVLPSGNTTQRPANAVLGTTRFNTTLDSLETWDGATWTSGGNTISPGVILDQQIIPDGVSSTYTLIQSATTTGVLVSINGVNQLPDIAYTIANTNITFNQVPLTQDLIDIRFISYVTSISSLTNSSGNSSITVTPAGNILFTTNGNVLSTMTSNTLAVAGDISASGNITTSGFFVGNIAGNISGNILAPGANTQVIYNNNGNFGASSGFTFDSALNLLTISGNVTGGNINTAGQVSATGNIIGANVNAVRLSGNLITPNQSNITSVGTLTSLNVNGNLTGSNISATTIRATTITAANIGNSTTQLFAADLNIGGYVIGNYYLGTILTASQTSITTVGDLTNLSVVGNIALGGQINVANTLSVSGNISTPNNIEAVGNILGSNFLTTGLISATGNITAGNITAGNIVNSTGNTLISVASGNIGFTTSNVTQATINSAGVFAISGQSLQLPSYTVAQAGNIATPAAGEVIYVSNGDAGAPSLAVFDGSSWKRIALGATISAT